METNFITIPFDLNLAKKISSGECKGNIITEKGYPVRIVCWDAKGRVNDIDWPIVALVKTSDEIEILMRYHNDRQYNSICGLNIKYNLLLNIPEEIFIKRDIKEESTQQNYLFNHFDKVLVRQSQADYWECAFFSNFTGEKHKYRCQGMNYMYCIPYNEETKHLVGTNEQWEK